ncbi:hypothetical protein AQUCO_00100653v1 [Aquilegia coerulea]|uniref:Uncharacterized protein n=1 Tax=Aquilegia coerulea TaxID=218851 RepID=A0A2G5FBD9_AQUCA|nr:hypothetical protein AQUCO_00100653v1 [Aquilegia coerulea]
MYLRKQKEKVGGARSISFNEQTVSISNVVPTNGLGCTDLWLQSAVPRGRTCSFPIHHGYGLELLPLTNKIITLDTCKLMLRKKAYNPEHSLKIYATSNITTEIF